MSDVDCPYCGAGNDICHDDGFGYAEGVKHEMQCHECEKTFVFETSISFYYEASAADCLNGAEHNLVAVLNWPNVFPNWVRCKDCGYEKRGEYMAPMEDENANR